MKAAQLRQAILQAAVQGKLVPQNQQDEPATELLKRIQAEKDRLTKEGKIKKEKLLPSISEEEMPFDLPKGWKWCRLNHIALEIATGPFGSMLHKSDYVQNGIPVINPANIKNENIIPSPSMMVSKSTCGRLSSYLLHADDVVIARRGDLGRCAIVPAHGDGWLCGTGSFILRLSSNIYLPYFTILFKSPICVAQLMGESVGATMNNLNHNILNNLKTPIPPFPEQRDIVAMVDELMNLCDELEAAEKDLDVLDTNLAEYLPKSILQAAVQGKLVPQNPHDEPASELLKRIQAEKIRLIKAGEIKKEKPLPPISEEEIPYDLPEGWKWCRLSGLGEIVGGSTPDSSNTDYYTGQGAGLPWVTPADMKTATNNVIFYGAKDITQKGFDSCSTQVLPKGSILFSSRAPIGLIAFAGTALCTNQGFKSIVPYLSELKNWIFYSLKQRTDNIISRAPGTTFKEVSGKFMEYELVPLPPLAEQQRIVTKVHELMELCKQLQNITPDSTSLLADIQKILPSLNSFIQSSEPEERYAIAARGAISAAETKEHRHAVADLFGDEVDG